MRTILMPTDEPATWKTYLELLMVSAICGGAIAFNAMVTNWPAVDILIVVVAIGGILVTVSDHVARMFPKALYSDLAVNEIEQALFDYEKKKKLEKRKEKPSDRHVEPLQAAFDRQAAATRQQKYKERADKLLGQIAEGVSQPQLTPEERDLLAKYRFASEPPSPPVASIGPVGDYPLQEPTESPYELNQEHETETTRDRLARQFGDRHVDRENSAHKD